MMLRPPTGVTVTVSGVELTEAGEPSKSSVATAVSVGPGGLLTTN